MAKSLNPCLLLAACLAAGGVAQAEVLPDPTRPAAEFLTQPGATAEAAAKPLPADEGLRTIIIAPDRRSAVINGKQTPLGGKVGDERLMAVCDDSVVLHGPEGRREVRLYPGVDIQGPQQKRCLTPETGGTLEAPRHGLNRAKYQSRRSAAAKERKVCK